MGPGAVLALNHQQRPDEPLPKEGFLTALSRVATGWRVLSGETPKGAEVRKKSASRGPFAHYDLCI